MTDRIAYFLDTGKVLSAPMATKKQLQYLPLLVKIQNLNQTLFVRKSIGLF
ncbi:hypothetical protein [Candidatus Merdisoma sp. JLR.KK006]|uniref:hypothetical protein n=1 Tax=Candidatus Merdisoma sp. JLR.KK006 TaxID=3112626 RepID=UPI002FF037BE